MRSRGKIFLLAISAAILIYAAVGIFYGRVAAKEDGYKDLRVFVDVVDKVSSEYVEKPNLDKAMEGALRGMLDALDPYSGYLPPDKQEQIERHNASAKGDIGLELSKRGGLIYVVAPISDGPAARAGIRPGDYIDSIDGISVQDLSLVEVYSLLRGPEDSSVKLSLIRGTSTEPVEVEIKRQALFYPPVSGRLLKDDIGYLKVAYFYRGASDEARSAIQKLAEEGARKLILDLRNAAGGDFSEGIALANLFLSQGVIAQSEGRSGKRTAIEAVPEKAVWKGPLIVLVNQSTAGPAEIVAGAVGDNKRGRLVGEKTFGYASRQKIVQLKSGGALILSVEKYLTPSGKAIQHESFKQAGIRPDYVVPEEQAKTDLLFRTYFGAMADQEKSYRKLIEEIERQQLEKAIEVASTS